MNRSSASGRERDPREANAVHLDRPDYGVVDRRLATDLIRRLEASLLTHRPGTAVDHIDCDHRSVAPSHPDYVPWASSPAARRTMLGNRRRDTAPELALRSDLHARGWRFRVQFPVPGRPRRSIDIAFTRRRVAVLVDGCFWHGCTQHGSDPKTNAAYWSAKVARNQARDRDTDEVLLDAGWVVVRIWEHHTRSDAVAIVEAALLTRSP